MVRLHFILVSCVCFFIANNAFAQDYSKRKTDSLINLLPQLPEDTVKVKVLNDIAYGHQFFNPNEGIRFGKMAATLAASLNFQKGLAASYAMIGINYSVLADDSNALAYETKAIESYRKAHNRTGEAAMLANISLLYTSQSDYPKALEFALDALKIYEELNLKINQAYLYDNIGTIYIRKKKFDKALECFNQAAAIYKNNNDRQGLARCMANKGIVFQELQKYDQALALHRQSFELNKSSGSKTSMQVNLNNIGNVLLSQGKLAEALQNFNEALHINREMGNEGGVATTSGNMGVVYLKMAELKTPVKTLALTPLDSARQMLTSSIEACKRLGLLHPETEFLQSLAKTYELSGDFKKAHETLKLYNHLNDSLNSSEIQQTISNLEMNREIELKNKNILLMEQAIQIRELEIKNKRFLLEVYALVILIAAVIIFILLRKILKQKSISRNLLRENEKYLHQINEQILDLKKHSRVLSEISYMQAHQVRGPLSTLLGLALLFKKDDPGHPDNIFVLENIEKVTKKIDLAIREVIMKETEVNPPGGPKK